MMWAWIAAAALVVGSVTLCVYVIVTNRWPWQPADYDPDQTRYVSRARVVDLDPQRPCFICAENDTLITFADDQELAEHLRAAHGDS